MMAEFRRSAHLYAPTAPVGEDPISTGALMQHYGAPTRFLDFTLSPWVACYFAAEEAEPGPASTIGAECVEPVIWAVDRAELRLGRFGRSELAAAADLPDYSSDFHDHLRPFFARDRRPSVASPRDVPAVGACAVRPMQSSARLNAQQGMFIVPTNINVSAADCIATALGVAATDMDRCPREDPDRHGTCEPTEPRASRVPVLYKIEFPRGAVPDVLHGLRRRNLHAASLFPDLSGFARSLRHTPNSFVHGRE